KPKIGFEIYPSPNLSTCVVEPYNALLATHWLLDHTENRKTRKLISKVISAMTASLRFSGELNVDLNEFQTNLVPFHRRINSAKRYPKNNKYCFKPANLFVKYTEFDPAEDKYMAISLNYRGDIKSKEANATVQWSKSNNKIALVEWCPIGFKIGLNEVPAVTLEADDIGAFSKNAVMIANNTGISRVLVNTLPRNMILCTRNEHLFIAREDLGFLEKDYLDVLSEQPTDDVGGDNAGNDAGDNDNY
ncbi:Tubulin alpha-2 chain, partial [Reticulomyxa filosa]